MSYYFPFIFLFRECIFFFFFSLLTKGRNKYPLSSSPTFFSSHKLKPGFPNPNPNVTSWKVINQPLGWYCPLQCYKFCKFKLESKSQKKKSKETKFGRIGDVIKTRRKEAAKILTLTLTLTISHAPGLRQRQKVFILHERRVGFPRHLHQYQ